MTDATALLLAASGDAEIISLRGIECFGYHGVYPSERREGQRFVVDVSLLLARRERRDDVTTTVDYGALASAVASDVAENPVDLIETLAGRLADRCLLNPVVSIAVVTVHKPDAPMPAVVADASVTVTRHR